MKVSAPTFFTALFALLVAIGIFVVVVPEPGESEGSGEGSSLGSASGSAEGSAEGSEGSEDIVPGLSDVGEIGYESEGSETTSEGSL